MGIDSSSITNEDLEDYLKKNDSEYYKDYLSLERDSQNRIIVNANLEKFLRKYLPSAF